MNQDKFPYGRTALISFGFFTNNLTWSAYNVYVPFFLSLRFQEILGEDAAMINTLVGIVMILDNIASILIQPYIGQLSDRTWVKGLGRRMPFVIIGLPLAAFFFGMIGSFQNTLWVLLVAICGFNISMAFYKSPVMSLVPDTLPKEYRSQGSGVLNVVGGLASITGLVIVSTLIKNDSPMSFWVSSIIMIVCLVILLFSVKEKKDVEVEKSDEKINLFKTFKKTFKEGDRTLIIMLVAIFFQTAGYTVVETFISRYSTDVLGFDESTSGFMLAVLVGFSVVMALPAGLIGRRIGPLNACLLGLTGFVGAIIPIMLISVSSTEVIKDLLTLNTWKPPYVEWTTPIYLALIVILGFSWLVVQINSIVVIWNMAPKRKTATFTSYFYVFNHFAAIVSPFLAGGIFDFFKFIQNKIGNESKSGLEIMFVYITIMFIVALALVFVVKIRRINKLREIEDTDEYIRLRLNEKEYPLLFMPMLLFGFGLRQEKALVELKRDQYKERLRMKREKQLLKRRVRRLKSEVVIGDYSSDELKYIEEIKAIQYLEKELRREHRKQRQVLLEKILKERMYQITHEENEKGTKLDWKDKRNLYKNWRGKEEDDNEKKKKRARKNKKKKEERVEGKEDKG